MALVKMFKAQKDTKRFRKNQIVWIEIDLGNYLRVYFKWRGKGRYVVGNLSKHNSMWTGANHVIGSYDNIKEIEVTEEFAKKVEYYKRNK